MRATRHQPTSISNYRTSSLAVPGSNPCSFSFAARLLTSLSSDILHPGRAGISKDELSEKLGGMYKATKDQISVFGLRSQYGGGKTTGFALVYDSPEAMQKFEPRYRLIRVGKATKLERAAKQQRTWMPLRWWWLMMASRHSSRPAILPRDNNMLTTSQASNARTV